MDRVEYVRKRKGRYMAQLLEEFEKKLEPRLPIEVSKEFKGMVRRKFEALATDVCELIELKDEAMNGAARDLKDRVYSDAAPTPSREEA